MTSPTKRKRKSLADCFEERQITSSHTSTPPGSPTKRTFMKQSLRETISRGWPSHRVEKSESVFMTIHADGIYRQSAEVEDPTKLFAKTKRWIEVLQCTNLNAENQDIVTKEIHEAMVRAIFGSNQIERAGLGLDITIQLCRKILAGENVANIVSERDPEYEKALFELCAKEPALKNMPSKYILGSRNEVVQHARAFQHIIDAFVVRKRDLDEDLIKETHRILVKGVPLVEPGYPDVQPEEYGGTYRTVVVGAGNTNFTFPKFIPAKMTEMCENLKRELADAESRDGRIDPVSVASKYSLEFVMIHPFRDGNGRMCRMILNSLLCRYAGVVVPIGELGEERSQYMEIKKRASASMDGHGEYARFVLSRTATRVREMKKKLSRTRSREP